jgi:hypothetical protein
MSWWRRTWIAHYLQHFRSLRSRSIRERLPPGQSGWASFSFSFWVDDLKPDRETR